MQHHAVRFPEWGAALAASGLDGATQQAFRREIIGFLRHGKQRRHVATVETARDYLRAGEGG